MKMKNVLWVALVGVAVSCTVSKRIDRWGYRVSFDKKSQGVETPANEVATQHETTLANLEATTKCFVKRSEHGCFNRSDTGKSRCYGNK